MGKFLDKIIEITIKKNKNDFEKEQKKIFSSAKSYYEKAVGNIEKAAKKGLFHTSITVNGEDSLMIAHMVEKKLTEEGFYADIETLWSGTNIKVAWAPFLYKH